MLLPFVMSGKQCLVRGRLLSTAQVEMFWRQDEGLGVKLLFQLSLLGLGLQRGRCQVWCKHVLTTIALITAVRIRLGHALEIVSLA